MSYDPHDDESFLELTLSPEVARSILLGLSVAEKYLRQSSSAVQASGYESRGIEHTLHHIGVVITSITAALKATRLDAEDSEGPGDVVTFQGASPEWVLDAGSARATASIVRHTLIGTAFSLQDGCDEVMHALLSGTPVTATATYEDGVQQSFALDKPLVYHEYVAFGDIRPL